VIFSTICYLLLAAGANVFDYIFYLLRAALRVAKSPAAVAALDLGSRF
jgi:hypothetical protein